MIFANIMQDKKDLNTFWKKALHKYRFVIMTDDSFEEKLSVKLSGLNIFAFIGFLIFFCFFSTLFLITYSPLSEYIPGKVDAGVRQELLSLSIKADSLTKTLENQKIYLQNITNIINGDQLISPKIIEGGENSESEISFDRSIEDSLLRVVVESEDKGSILINTHGNHNVLMFFTPIKGVITDGFNIKTKHFGVDLVAKEKTRISSILDGTVIISHWTFETGYVIGVQHKSGYFSLYKHNSVLLRSVGDFVNTGDHIAIIGNSGELSSGPHLHFELWRQGIAVNPENYILF
jgi:murein DD-endopeptidase MepM/ murein hydrolase activator NlpD